MWRVIKPRAYSAYLSQALVETLTEFVGQGKSPSTIRFYEWKPSTVAFGFNERVHEVVNVDECKNLGIDIVRRPSGGGAVYLDEEDCFTYGVISRDLPRSISKSYSLVCGAVIDGLMDLGIEASFRKPNDIVVKGKKISGNIQINRKNVVVVGGTILYDLDLEKMFRVLKVDKEKMKKKGYKNSLESVTCIKEHTKVSKQKVYETLIRALTKGKEFSFGDLNQEEMDRAKFLEKTKYSTREWNFRK